MPVVKGAISLFPLEQFLYVVEAYIYNTRA